MRARRIDVDYASHSAQVDAIREPLVQALTGIDATFVLGGLLLDGHR